MSYKTAKVNLFGDVGFRYRDLTVKSELKRISLGDGIQRISNQETSPECGHGLLIRRRKRIARTTDANHVYKRYPNLIKELMITGPEQLYTNPGSFFISSSRLLQLGYNQGRFLSNSQNRQVFENR